MREMQRETPAGEGQAWGTPSDERIHGATAIISAGRAGKPCRKPIREARTEPGRDIHALTKGAGQGRLRTYRKARTVST